MGVSMEQYSTISISSHCSLAHHCHWNLGFRASWWNVAAMSTELGEHWTSFDILVNQNVKAGSVFAKVTMDFCWIQTQQKFHHHWNHLKHNKTAAKNWVIQNPMEKWRNKVLLEYVHYTKFYISYARHITLQPSRSTHPIWTSTHPISKQWVW